MLQWTTQPLMQVEAENKVGPEKGEHTPDHRMYRNGNPGEEMPAFWVWGSSGTRLPEPVSEVEGKKALRLRGLSQHSCTATSPH